MLVLLHCASNVLEVMRACFNFFRPGCNGWNGCVLFEFPGNRATDPNKKSNPTDFSGGTAQLHPKTGVPSRAASALDAENDIACKYAASQA